MFHQGGRNGSGSGEYSERRGGGRTEAGRNNYRRNDNWDGRQQQQQQQQRSDGGGRHHHASYYGPSHQDHRLYPRECNDGSHSDPRRPSDGCSQIHQSQYGGAASGGRLGPYGRDTGPYGRDTGPYGSDTYAGGSFGRDYQHRSYNDNESVGRQFESGSGGNYSHYDRNSGHYGPATGVCAIDEGSSFRGGNNRAQGGGNVGNLGGGGDNSGSCGDSYGDRGLGNYDRGQNYGSSGQRGHREQGSTNYYRNRGASNRGGRGRDYGGRGGRGGGGDGGFRHRESGDGRGSRRGGGRGRAGIQQVATTQVQSVLTNIILAEPSPNFSFYLYTVDCFDRNNQSIDSRQRRKQLFESGLWEGVLQNKLSNRERDDLQRVVFFAGAYCFSGRAIPQLEASKLPITLCDGSETNGDVMRVLRVFHYITPRELIRDEPYPESSTPPSTLSTAACDMRCSQCTKAFTDFGALVQHCADTSHSPVYTCMDDTNGSSVENVEDAKSPSRPNIPSEPIRAQLDVFTAYVNLALSRALSERYARWGQDFIDPQSCKEPTDSNTGKSLGVRVFEAYSCQFGIVRAPDPCLALTVDLRAKVVRTASVLDQLYGDRDKSTYRFDPREQQEFRSRFKSQVVIYMSDKRCYSVVDLIFEQSPDTLMVDGLGVSHTNYFRDRKDIVLKYPSCVPMVAVLGRRNQTIFLPAELIAFNDLHTNVKPKLPSISSFPPEDRNKCIAKIQQFLIPGAQKSRGISGLLPALGITLSDERLTAKAKVLAMPAILAAGLPLKSDQGGNWTNSLREARFNVNPNHVVNLNVVLVCNKAIQPQRVYETIRDMVNRYNSHFRFGNEPYCVVNSGNTDTQHWGAVETYFSNRGVPPNVFVVDFTFPQTVIDPAYPVVKRMLCGKGYLSQFVNFRKVRHDHIRGDPNLSHIILGSVARQILQKCGVRVWWVEIPKSLPLPCIFVGVDVFHSPRVYDEHENKRVGKASCAAIIIQVVREGSEDDRIEMYAKTFKRAPGKEYELGDALEQTLTEAMQELNVKPASCVVWRDGIGDTAFDHAIQEIKGIRGALTSARPEAGTSKCGKWEVPLSYVVCQKRIATKLFTRGIPGQPDGKFSAPSGTLVEDIQSLRHFSFFINGRAPPYSTAKPVRFIVAEHDDGLKGVSIPDLTWQQSHDYPNWAGPIKVPSVCQLAHKLAELAGGFSDCGESIDDKKTQDAGEIDDWVHEPTPLTSSTIWR